MGDCPSSEQLPFEDPYAVLTVNLPESERLAANEQFVDSNNLHGIGDWLVQNGIAVPTNYLAQSGFCTYQAYAFRIPDRLIENIVTSREDSIAERLITEIEASGMKPSEKNERGELYIMSSYGRILQHRLLSIREQAPRNSEQRRISFFWLTMPIKGSRCGGSGLSPKGCARILQHRSAMQSVVHVAVICRRTQKCLVPLPEISSLLLTSG